MKRFLFGAMISLIVGYTFVSIALTARLTDGWMALLLVTGGGLILGASGLILYIVQATKRSK